MSMKQGHRCRRAYRVQPAVGGHEGLSGSSLRACKAPLQYWHDVAGTRMIAKGILQVTMNLVAVKHEQ